MSERWPPRSLPAFLQGLLPFRISSLELQREPNRGLRLSFLEHGPPEGSPVFLLHGNPTWSFLWRKVIVGLAAKGYRCIAPDLLGFGLSDRLPTPRDHDVERHASSLLELIDFLQLQGIVLVGQDWGGPLAVICGAELGGRVSGVVLANTSVLVPSRPRGTAFHRLARIPLLSDLVFRGLGFPQNILGFAQGDRASIRGEVARAYRWPFRSWKDRAGPLGLARMVPNGSEHPSVPALRRGEAWLRGFQGPVSLVWGLKDPILGRALPRHEKAFPRARVYRTEAGHFLQEEVPETLSQAVVELQTARRLES